MEERFEKAIFQEIKHTKEQVKSLQNKSLVELRKTAFVFYPLNCVDFSQGNELSVFQFQSSFVLNDSIIRKGSQVEIRYNSGKFQGRVVELLAQNIIVSSKEEIEFNPKDESFEIHHIPDERTLQCLEIGLKLFKDKAIFKNSLVKEKISLIENWKDLTNAQTEAVNAILSNNEIVCIQGPPGTGKTKTLAIAIEKLLLEGKRIIVSAPSNTAIDNLVKKIITITSSVLRVGNDEKIDDAVLPFTFDGHLQKGSYEKSIQQLEKQRRNAEMIAFRFVRNHTAESANEKKNARIEMRAIQKEIRSIYSLERVKCIEEAKIIAGTPVAIFNQLPKEFVADYVIIDEAGQCLAPLSWLVGSFGKKIILCGDPQQLPPTVMSFEAQKLGLGKSWLELLFEQQSEAFHLLDTQFRMDLSIVECINERFYGNRLQSKSVELGKCTFFDITAFGEGEKIDEVTGSISHETEVNLIAKIIEVEKLSPLNTVILSPYSAQLALLQKKLGGTWKISTIDSIQGQEADNIIISLVRSNEDGIIGFLKDYRRTNVAISRAKNLCYIVGDSATLGNDSFYADLIDDFEKTGNYRSIWEFEE